MIPGALFDVQFDGTLLQDSGGTSIFRNDGTYRKSAGANTNTIQIVSFINTGTASVSSGVIRFGTTTVTATGTGNTFFSGSGASLLFNQANNFTNSSFSGSVFKYLAVGVGEAMVVGNIAATNLVFTAGTWRGTATLQGTLEWTGGTLSPKLTIPVGSTLKLTGNAAKTLGNNGVITNAGTLTWTAGQFNLDNNQTFYNLAGALFDVQFDGTMIQNFGGISIFRNDGTYRKSAGANTNTIYWRVRVARQALQQRLGDDAAVEAEVNELRTATTPPRGAAKQCWLAIVPQLGKPSLLTTVFASWSAAKLAIVGAGLTVAIASHHGLNRIGCNLNPS